MSKKEKQTIDAFTLPPEDAYEDDNEVFNPSFFAGLAKDKAKAKETVAPVSKEKQAENKEREKKIRELYPDFYEQDIPLDKLVFAPEEWNFFPRWDNQMMTELMENIAVYGQLSPALVWDQGDGTYMILGGHNRYQAIDKLHEILQKDYPEEAKLYTTMRCNVYAADMLDEIEARKIIIFDNTIRRENSKSIMRRSIINMNQLMKDTRAKRRPDTKRKTIREEIAETMNVSPRTVTGMARLQNLIKEFWPLFDKKGEEKLSDSLAQAISYLSDDLQYYVYSEELYKGAHLQAAQLKMLRNAQTEEEVKEAFSTPKTYTLSAKKEMNKPLPRGYQPVILPVKNEEIDALKAAIDVSDLSEETKKIIFSLL